MNKMYVLTLHCRKVINSIHCRDILITCLFQREE